uniref:Uncharacterized protein n=1 Tax=Panagrolaimus davidi TaxID=227884 RepID=A0A914QAY3_9BILA
MAPELNLIFCNISNQRMDLTVALMENPPSNGESNRAEDGGMIVRDSKRAKFMATYHHQNFSMRDSLIFYITANPKIAELYLKMIKTCKYFFVKNPILVIDRRLNYYCQWTIAETPYDLNRTTSKLWIADGLFVFPKSFITAETKDQNILTSIIPKLYQCHVRVLSLHKQVMSSQDLPLLISSAKRICFDQVVVKNEDGSNVDVQKVVEIASKATWIIITHPSITSKTMEELLKITHFPTLRIVTLKNVPDVFDIELLCSYEITDEIIATKEFDYKPALFRFRELDYARYKKLYDIFYQK